MEMGYLDWLVSIISSDDYNEYSYQKLLTELYDTEFVWTVKNDDNRALDGLGFRDAYEDETGETCEKDGECSVLEMLVALAYRCENEIMWDPDEGNRTGVWFWEMITNLGLDRLDDWHFDGDVFIEIMRRFLNREYCKDGYGGPFYIEGFALDMRKIELWYQLNYYLQSKFSW